MRGISQVPFGSTEITEEGIADFNTALAHDFEWQKKAQKQAYAEMLADQERFNNMRIAGQKNAEKEIIKLGLIETEEQKDAELAKLENSKKLLDNRIAQARKASEELKKIEADYASGVSLNDTEMARWEAIKQQIADAKKAEEDLNKIREKQAKLNSKNIAKDRKEAAKIRKDEAKRAEKEIAREKASKTKANIQKISSNAFGMGVDLRERKAAIKDAYRDIKAETGSSGKAMVAVADALTKGLSNLAQQLDQNVTTIASMKTAIDTRLQGSDNERSKGSYWNKITKDIVGIAGISPLVRQSDIASNVKSMVEQGIAFNVEQRALIATLKDKIASTFDATDATLKRLIRIQQEDSTANRLGLESALNTFMNQMYENSEYLGQIAAGVRTSLEEAQSLMEASAAAELEYEVEKWLGSLYSVGASSEAVSTISGALGKVAAGDISGLTGGGGNLVIMAAGQAGLSITDILEQGLYGDNANKLLSAMVEYLAEIYENAKDSKVVQQQIANVYGLQASDLKAITNLLQKTEGDQDLLGVIKTTTLNYDNMLEQLADMAGSMSSRVSLGERLETIWDNTKYSIAAGIADNPFLYGTYKIAGLLDSVVGGVSIPAVYAVGSGVDLETTVADLMRVTAMSGGILDSLAQIVTAGSGGGGFTAKSLISSMGIGKDKVKMKTKARKTGRGDKTTSESGYTTYTANAESGAVLGKTMAEAEDTKVQAQESASNKEMTISDFYDKLTNNYLISINKAVSEINRNLTGRPISNNNAIIATEPGKSLETNAIITSINAGVYSELRANRAEEHETLKDMLNTILNTLGSISGNTSEIKTNMAILPSDVGGF